MQFIKILVAAIIAVASPIGTAHAVDDAPSDPPKLVYIVSDLRIPFWDIMWRGVQSRAEALGYEIDVYSANNDPKSELQQTGRILRSGIDGIIVSPINSSTCVTILKLAEFSEVPVVISDIGTESGEYVAYISSDNEGGSYELGKILAQKMSDLGWQDGRVGIIAIPQKRSNGKARTTGFMRAMDEAGIKGAGLRQQVTFSYRETYDFTEQLIREFPDLRALWLQGSDRYQAALDAIKDRGKTGEILLLTFDAEPEFLELIPQGRLVGAGMQQPFLMGEKAVEAIHLYFQGQDVQHEQRLGVLAVSTDNIEAKLPIIRRNVLGLD